MRKSCAQVVGTTRISDPGLSQLSTQSAFGTAVPWKNLGVYPPFMHNFCVQLYTAKAVKITELRNHSSPLSTTPTINTPSKTRENFLVVRGG